MTEEMLLRAAKEYGFAGFALVLFFIYASLSLNIFYKMFTKMLAITESSTKAMQELTTYLRGRNGK